jgi:Tfp pilus assembly protein PilF
MNLRRKRAILLSTSFSLLAVFVIFYIPGCSMKEGFFPLGRYDGIQDDPDLLAFVSSIRPRPGNPNSHYLLAGYYQERGQHREAVEEFKKVLAIDPRYVKAYNGLGVSYDLLGESSRAVAAYKAAISLDPKQAYLYNNLGYSHLTQGNPERAIFAFQKAIALNPQERRFHNNLAFAYSEKALFALAMEEFRHGGDEAQAHFNMAEVYFKNGIYAKARDHYTAALRLKPSYTLARTGAKAAETMASIFGSTQKNARTQVEMVIPEPPKVEKKLVSEKNAVPSESEEISTPLEKTTPPETQVIKAFSMMDSESINTQVPVIQLSSLEKYREEEKEIQSTRESDHSRKSSANYYAKGNGDGSGDWDYEVKMAILSGKSVSMPPEEPRDIQKTAIAKNAETRRNIGIEVSNGNGANQMAKRVGHYLQKKGYPVGRLTNSQNFNQGHTQIYYQEGNGEIANQVAEQLPTHKDIIEIKKLDRPSIQVRVLLGKDMIPHNNKFR